MGGLNMTISVRDALRNIKGYAPINIGGYAMECAVIRDFPWVVVNIAHNAKTCGRLSPERIADTLAYAANAYMSTGNGDPILVRVFLVDGELTDIAMGECYLAHFGADDLIRAIPDPRD